MSYPKIEPIRLKEYTTKQSKYSQVAKLPMRSIVLGPSGSGKTIILQNMILDVYAGCFDKIYVFSPSVHLDSTWLPVKDYVKDKMKQDIDNKDDQMFFDEYEPEALARIIDTQRKITDYMKKQKKTKLFQILIIIDDWADSPSFVRNNKLLHSLYTRGRHSAISVITATQVFNALHPIIRKNATDLYIYRLRNYRDLESLVEELSALSSKKTLLEMYNLATAEPYSFWYINLMQNNINKMFFIKFQQRLTIN
jgi:hypothetical protein